VKCYSVSELNEVARGALFCVFDEESWVVGEIHGLKVHAKSGHMYFDLVEKSPSKQGQYLAKASCAFFLRAIRDWQGLLRREGFASFELNDGMEVKLKAKVDLYVKEGRYQLIVSEVDPRYSLGAIARRRAQTIETLKASGLMEKNKLLELAACPLAIGLITSVGSAAYNDFMSIVGKSGYAFRITLCDAHMQGERTSSEVVQGIRMLEERDLDVIAIVRGGGARTDLFSFDDLEICRTIANCRYPVITGIGHEIDLSVADMVAYRHFVTPTDAARFVVACLDGVWGRIEDARQGLIASAMLIIDATRERLHYHAMRLVYITQSHAMQALAVLRSLTHGFTTRLVKILSQEEGQLHRMQQSIEAASLYALKTQASLLAMHRGAIDQGSVACVHMAEHAVQTHFLRMQQGARQALSRAADSLAQLEKWIALMDPGQTLKRGFSITLDKGAKAITGTEGIEPGDPLTTILYQGRIHSVVKDKEPT